MCQAAKVETDKRKRLYGIYRVGRGTVAHSKWVSAAEGNLPRTSGRVSCMQTKHGSVAYLVSGPLSYEQALMQVNCKDCQYLLQK